VNLAPHNGNQQPLSLTALTSHPSRSLHRQHRSALLARSPTLLSLPPKLCVFVVRVKAFVFDLLYSNIMIKYRLHIGAAWGSIEDLIRVNTCVR